MMDGINFFFQSTSYGGSQSVSSKYICLFAVHICIALCCKHMDLVPSGPTVALVVGSAVEMLDAEFKQKRLFFSLFPKPKEKAVPLICYCTSMNCWLVKGICMRASEKLTTQKQYTQIHAVSVYLNGWVWVSLGLKVLSWIPGANLGPTPPMHGSLSLHFLAEHNMLTS